MPPIKAAILGVIQGLAEFLPISSSGHLVLFQHLMGMDDSEGSMMLLTVLLHVGTLIAVIAVFWEDWWNILTHPFRSHTIRMLILASLPALVVAVLVKVLFGSIDVLFGSGFLGISFLITGVLLLITERCSHRGKHVAHYHQVGVKHALIMGGMQAFAMIPGVSRSGSTLFGGVASGLSRKRAAKFSFMMSAPAILGSLLLEGKDALESGAFEYLSANWGAVALGVALAAVSGFLAIRYMLKLINHVSLNWFALYVFIIGGIVIALQITGRGGLPPISLPFVGSLG